MTARANLLVYYAFDEGSGVDVRDISGNGNNAIMHNMDDTSWVDGKEQMFGTCLALDGIDDYLTTDGFFSEPLDGDFTLSMWFTGTPGRRARLFQLRAGDTQMVNVRIIDDILSIDDHGGVQVEDSGDVIVTDQQWYHFAIVRSGLSLIAYLDGEQHMDTSLQEVLAMDNVSIGVRDRDGEQDDYLPGKVDDFRIYTVALSADEIGTIMVPGGAFPQASGPNPKNGALYTEIWASPRWKAGDFAVTHDVYFSDNFDDVNDGTGDAFIGNQDGTYFLVGLPTFAYPDGLVHSTTYYWRIDEVNDADPNSPWKGDIWSFTVPPRTAYNPDPADGAGFVDPNAILSWAAGLNAQLHTVYIGTDFDDVNAAAGGDSQGWTTYSPGTLESGKVYYWRVDEYDGTDTYKGDIWSFTTPGAVGNPVPANGAADVKMTATLSWTPADNAASHEVYFGTEKDAVRNADKNSPEYEGPKALGAESYDPGKLAWYATYYWRVDEVDTLGGLSKGPPWSFTTADFISVDEFEDYDIGNNEIWWAWKDGLGYAAHDSEPAYSGNGTGSAVGDETTLSYMEEKIVHGGGKSMPVVYDNNQQGYAYYSEVELTLSATRDWTEEGVGTLTIWFRGKASNGAEPLYVAVSNIASDSAIVVHDDPAAAQLEVWTKWEISLQTIADQGIVLTDVDRIAIGLGTRGNLTIPGGAGKMYYDDIRLDRLIEAAE